MCGVMKGKKQDKGNSENKSGESKIIRKQAAPIMPSVIQRAPIEATVLGSTHVVEMIGHTLFNGKENSHLQNQGVFLRQGTKVIIDNQVSVLSRRGPNQSFFREEDKKRGTHIYRWVRVLSIDGKDVSGENLYIKEGTFIEEAFMGRRVLSPPSGGIRPSIGVAPGTRHMPLLRPPGLGEEGRDVLTPEQRSLNRLARGEWVTLSGKAHEKTPHLAMMVWKGKIYVAGNTDRAVPMEVLQESVVVKLRELIKKTSDGVFKNKRVKMERKLSKIEQGEYHNSEYQNSEMMLIIQKAIKNPGENIQVIEAKQAGEDGVGLTPIHGEMMFLDMLYDEYLQREIENPRENPRRRLKKIFAGGNLQDCIFCHWAFDIFNRLIGIEIGVFIVSSGTHGQIPSKWVMPRWMREMEKARTQFENILKRYKINYQIKDNVIIVKAGKMKDTMLSESDSEG